MGKNYTQKISHCSKQLTNREKANIIVGLDAVTLDEAIPDGSDTKLSVDIDYVVTLDIHDEKSDEKDYVKYLIVGKDGDVYSTSSSNVMENYFALFDLMEGEEFTTYFYKAPSKNYKGKFMLLCGIV